MWRVNEANKYTLFGILFGFCFPVGSILFLYLIGQLSDSHSLVEIVREAHRNNVLLYVIDSAPLFLGLFARLAGIRQDRILYFSESLEAQVREKTESLRAMNPSPQKYHGVIMYVSIANWNYIYLRTQVHSRVIRRMIRFIISIFHV